MHGREDVSSVWNQEFMADPEHGLTNNNDIDKLILLLTFLSLTLFLSSGRDRCPGTLRFQVYLRH